jgi:hypothetical protein
MSSHREHQAKEASLQAAQQQLAAELSSTKDQLEAHIADMIDEVRSPQT